MLVRCGSPPNNTNIVLPKSPGHDSKINCPISQGLGRRARHGLTCVAVGPFSVLCASSRKQSSVDLMNGEDRMPIDTALARVSRWGMHLDDQPRVWELS